ncbi:MAG: LEA type 2 family protein [Gemmatimonadota bacterium]|nr:LEA type 2 family protein [Gemmatimonadota bacterium]
MRKLRVIAVAAAALTIASVGACATLGLGSWTQPVVTLKDVRVRGLGMTGGSVNIVLNVYNPNGFSLNGTRLTYKLMVDTVPFGAGATDQKFVVNSNDSTTVTLPLDFSYTGLNTAIREAMAHGTVNYRVLGDITVGTAIGNKTIGYDRTGSFAPLGGFSR